MICIVSVLVVAFFITSFRYQENHAVPTFGSLASVKADVVVVAISIVALLSWTDISVSAVSNFTLRSTLICVHGVVVITLLGIDIHITIPAFGFCTVYTGIIIEVVPIVASFKLGMNVRISTRSSFTSNHAPISIQSIVVVALFLPIIDMPIPTFRKYTVIQAFISVETIAIVAFLEVTSGCLQFSVSTKGIFALHTVVSFEKVPIIALFSAIKHSVSAPRESAAVRALIIVNLVPVITFFIII